MLASVMRWAAICWALYTWLSEDGQSRSAESYAGWLQARQH